MPEEIKLSLNAEEARTLLKAIKARLDSFWFDGPTEEEAEEIETLKAISQRIAQLTDE